MKNNSTTLSFCTANCCSWFYHLRVWYLYKFLCNFRRELVCRALQSMIHCSELGDRKWAATRWVTADSSWRTGLLPGAGQAGANTQNSPLVGSLSEKGKQHHILEVYYFHIPGKLICMWAFSSPLRQVPTLSFAYSRNAYIFWDKVRSRLYYLYLPMVC